jgi:hypothetical protein
MIRDVHPRSYIFNFFLILPDPVHKGQKAPDPGCGGRNLPEGCSPDALGPDGLVEAGVNPHVSRSHLLLSKLLDLLHSQRVRVKKTAFVEGGGGRDFNEG